MFASNAEHFSKRMTRSDVVPEHGICTECRRRCMNYMLIPTCGLALVLFAVGMWAGGRMTHVKLGLLAS